MGSAMVGEVLVENRVRVRVSYISGRLLGAVLECQAWFRALDVRWNMRGVGDPRDGCAGGGRARHLRSTPDPNPTPTPTPNPTPNPNP